MTRPLDWPDLVKQLGEDEARKELARKLRLAADHVEQRGSPYIVGCAVERPGTGLCERHLEEVVSVEFSHPWGG